MKESFWHYYVIHCQSKDCERLLSNPSTQGQKHRCVTCNILESSRRPQGGQIRWHVPQKQTGPSTEFKDCWSALSSYRPGSATQLEMSQKINVRDLGRAKAQLQYLEWHRLWFLPIGWIMAANPLLILFLVISSLLAYSIITKCYYLNENNSTEQNSFLLSSDKNLQCVGYRQAVSQTDKPF